MKTSHRLYMDSIDKNQPLSKKEETALFVEAKKGSQKAVNMLMTANLKFVVKVARHYKNQGVDLEDLISAGNLGLHRAIEDFDHTRNIKFISYAVSWIRSYILTELAEQSRFLKISGQEAYKKSKVLKATDKLLKKLGRTPTLKELSKETGHSITRLLEMEVLNPQTSLYSKFENGEYADFLPDTTPSTEEITDSKEKILNFVNKAPLSPKQKDVITRYSGIGYENGYTLEEIGEKWNQTRERMRVIRNDAVEILERFNRNQKSNNDLYLTPDMMEA